LILAGQSNMQGHAQVRTFRQIGMETGVNDRLLVEHLKSIIVDITHVVPSYDSERGYELAGFAWFQGWDDMVDLGTYPNRDTPVGYDAYSVSLPPVDCMLPSLRHLTFATWPAWETKLPPTNIAL